MKAIIMNNVSLSHQDSIEIKDVNISIEEGLIYGILGPVGAGKTAVLDILVGLKSYDSGEVYLLEDKIEEIESINDYIGMHLQGTVYPKRMKVKTVLDLFANLYVSPIDYEQKLVKYDLEDIINDRIGQLDEVDYLKLSLLLAQINNPDIVVIDDLTKGYTLEQRKSIYKYIKDLKKDGKTVVITTSFIDEIDVLCDEICIINEGRVLTSGTVKSVIEESHSTFEISFELISDIRLNGFLELIGEAEAAIDGKHVTIVTNEEDLITKIIIYLDKMACQFKGFNIKRPTLNDAYETLLGGMHV